MADLEISGIDRSTGQKKRLTSGDDPVDSSGSALLRTGDHGTTDHAGLPGILLLEAGVSISSVEILALHMTPITLIAAPASGFHLRIESVSAKVIHGGTDYVSSGGMLDITYTDASGFAVTMPFTEAFMEAGADELAIRVAIDVEMVPEAAAIVASSPSAFTLGDGTMDLKILYRIVSMT